MDEILYFKIIINEVPVREIFLLYIKKRKINYYYYRAGFTWAIRMVRKKKTPLIKHPLFSCRGNCNHELERSILFSPVTLLL